MFTRTSLKGTSQPPPFSMLLKLVILHGEAKSYCCTSSCFPEVCLTIFSNFSDFPSRCDMLRIKFIANSLMY